MNGVSVMVPESVVVPTAAPAQQPEDRHGPGVSSSARRVDHSPLRLEALRAWSAVTTVHHPRGPASQSLMMMVLVDKWRCQDWAGVSLPKVRSMLRRMITHSTGLTLTLPQFGTVEEFACTQGSSHLPMTKQALQGSRVFPLEIIHTFCVPQVIHSRPSSAAFDCVGQGDCHEGCSE
jgi:hypothetical protein